MYIYIHGKTGYYSLAPSLLTLDVVLFLPTHIHKTPQSPYNVNSFKGPPQHCFCALKHTLSVQQEK